MPIGAYMPIGAHVPVYVAMPKCQYSYAFVPMLPRLSVDKSMPIMSMLLCLCAFVSTSWLYFVPFWFYNPRPYHVSLWPTCVPVVLTPCTHALMARAPSIMLTPCLYGPTMCASPIMLTTCPYDPLLDLGRPL